MCGLIMGEGARGCVCYESRGGAENVMRETECYIKAVFVQGKVDRIGLDVTVRYIKAFFVHLGWTGSA
jgi:hypothetical protein